MPPRRRRARRAQPVLPPFVRRRSTLWLLAATATLGIGLLLGRLSGAGGGDGDEATPAPATRVSSSSPTQTPAPTPTLALALPEIEPDASQLERARVVDVIDGDTIDVVLDGATERVRYYGIDTPERGGRCFGESTDRNEALAGESVLLLPDARDRDSFGRLLRYVFSEDGDSIDARLIAEGLALAWTEDGAYRDALVALEADARAADAGCLWE